MTAEQVDQLFLDLGNVARNLNGSLLTAIANGASGSLTVMSGGVIAEVKWPYQYSDRKIDLKLTITRREEP